MKVKRIKNKKLMKKLTTNIFVNKCIKNMEKNMKF